MNHIVKLTGAVANPSQRNVQRRIRLHLPSAASAWRRFRLLVGSSNTMSIAGLVLVVLALSTAASAQNLAFNDTPYSNSAFSATFPAGDVKSTNDGNTNTYKVILQDDGIAFGITYVDNVTSDSPLRGGGAGLDRGLDASAEVTGPKTDALLGALPGREMSGATSDDAGIFVEWGRIALRGDRAWLATVVCYKGTNCTDADANKFFDSIVIK